MKKSSQFSLKVRERAVRIVQGHGAEHPSQWAAIESIADKIRCVPQALLTWVTQYKVDAGHSDGVSTAEAQRIKGLEREVREQQLGVDSVCRVLQIAPSAHWRHAACPRSPALRSLRAQRDTQVLPQVQRVLQANHQVYGAEKVWRQLNREGVAVARCTVERLMLQLMLQGMRRSNAVRTAIADSKTPCPLHRVNR